MDRCPRRARGRAFAGSASLRSTLSWRAPGGIRRKRASRRTMSGRFQPSMNPMAGTKPDMSLAHGGLNRNERLPEPLALMAAAAISRAVAEVEEKQEDVRCRTIVVARPQARWAFIGSARRHKLHGYNGGRVTKHSRGQQPHGRRTKSDAGSIQRRFSDFPSASMPPGAASSRTAPTSRAPRRSSSASSPPRPSSIPRAWRSPNRKGS